MKKGHPAIDGISGYPLFVTLSQSFETLFHSLVGHPDQVEAVVASRSQRWVHGIDNCQRYFSPGQKPHLGVSFPIFLPLSPLIPAPVGRLLPCICDIFAEWLEMRLGGVDIVECGGFSVG